MAEMGFGVIAYPITRNADSAENPDIYSTESDTHATSFSSTSPILRLYHNRLVTFSHHRIGSS